MAKWEDGRWNPGDWGLQNDPIHARAMMEYRAEQRIRDQLVQNARGPSSKFDDQKVAMQESEWERYVKWFCQRYECDDQQRTQANAILKSSVADAVRYRNWRKESFAKVEASLSRTDSPDKKKEYQEELDRLQAPIGEIFDRMKKRLHEQVLTTAQRAIDAELVKADATKESKKE